MIKTQRKTLKYLGGFSPLRTSSCSLQWFLLLRCVWRTCGCTPAAACPCTPVGVLNTHHSLLQAASYVSTGLGETKPSHGFQSFPLVKNPVFHQFLPSHSLNKPPFWESSLSRILLRSRQRAGISVQEYLCAAAPLLFSCVVQLFSLLGDFCMGCQQRWTAWVTKWQCSPFECNVHNSGRLRGSRICTSFCGVTRYV